MVHGPWATNCAMVRAAMRPLADCHRASAIVGADCAQDGGDMHLDRAFRDTELLADLLVRQALGDQPQQALWRAVRDEAGDGFRGSLAAVAGASRGSSATTGGT